MIHVCSLAALPDTVRTTGASHILTVMANVDKVQRPASILEANHLKVSMDDINEPADGFVAPNDAHILQLLAFVRGWDRKAPLVVHCYAGISRSSERLHRRLRAQPASRRGLHRTANPRGVADRATEPPDRGAGGQSPRPRGTDAARAR